MKYGYTDIRELQVSVILSLHDIDRLRRCIAEFEPEENVWFFRRFKETLKETQLKVAESMDFEARHIKQENTDETN